MWGEVLGFVFPKVSLFVDGGRAHEVKLEEAESELSKAIKKYDTLGKKKSDLQDLEKELAEKKEKLNKAKEAANGKRVSGEELKNIKRLTDEVGCLGNKIDDLSKEIKQIVDTYSDAYQLLMVGWVKKMREIDDKINLILGEKLLKKCAVSKDEVKSLVFKGNTPEVFEEKYNEFKDDISRVGKTLYSEMKLVKHLEWYDKFNPICEKLCEKIDLFVSRAIKTYDGDIVYVQKRKAGTFVTLKLVPVSILSGDKIEMHVAIVEYFVHSSYPLDFHVGLAWKKFKDLKFEKVQGLASQDMYQLVKEGEGDFEGVGFLSYRFDSKKTKKPIIWLSLGTDFKKPGKSIYLGVSERFFKKLFISTGFVFTEVTEADQETKIEEKIIDKVVDVALPKTRTLYAAIKNKNVVKWYFSISFGVF